MTKPTVLLWLYFAARLSCQPPPEVLWHDPGNVERLDFRWGIGGKELAPVPPFTFVAEDTAGTNPKVKVKDARGVSWSVKWGPEATPDTFSTRLAWAVGYYVEPTYFVDQGVITGVHGLKRAKHEVDQYGHFVRGRFQLRAKNPEFLKDMNWEWDKNPFSGTAEMSGLKIIMLMVSNWDNKDQRDKAGDDSNNAVFRLVENGHATLLYEVTDWGASLGKWGGFFGRSKCDCSGYTEQTPSFIKGVKADRVLFGYHGKHTHDEVTDITLGDVRWLMRYLGRITDRQLEVGLASSGATPDQTECFKKAIRARIEELRAIEQGAPGRVLTKLPDPGEVRPMSARPEKH